MVDPQGRPTHGDAGNRAHPDQVARDTRLTLSRDDAALTIVEAMSRSHLARQAIVVLDGDRHAADALDAIPPRPLPPSARRSPTTRPTRPT